MPVDDRTETPFNSQTVFSPFHGERGTRQCDSVFQEPRPSLIEIELVFGTCYTIFTVSPGLFLDCNSISALSCKSGRDSVSDKINL